jgi:hypothetical protein
LERLSGVGQFEIPLAILGSELALRDLELGVVFHVLPSVGDEHHLVVYLVNSQYSESWIARTPAAEHVYVQPARC